MFRRLYWIVEQIGTDGSSQVTGVYTSIQDLVGKGLQWSPDINSQQMRLTLLKPDTFNHPLGTWNRADFDGLRGALQTYVQTHEFSEEEVDTLCQALNAFVA